MSTRNERPNARANALADYRSGDPRQAPVAPARTQRYSRAEYAKVLALQEEVARADADYQRLRTAYLGLVESEPSNEVGLAMIGYDMDRAHARLQALIGLPRLPFTHEPSAVMRREAQRGEENR